MTQLSTNKEFWTVGFSISDGKGVFLVVIICIQYPAIQSYFQISGLLFLCGVYFSVKFGDVEKHAALL